MKIDMMESLGYSFLRHVRGCWVVQTNWKASTAGLSDDAWGKLKTQFEKMRKEFGDDVFKETRTVQQLLRQAEIDVVGVNAAGEVHALEAAFHEWGLRYPAGPVATVRKKMLRTQLALQAFAGFATHHHVWFVSPKVAPKPASGLSETFTKLRESYPDVTWHLCIGESFFNDVLQATLDKSQRVSDTSELFLRAERVLRGSSGR